MSGAAYTQVKEAVKYMTEEVQTGRHSIDFVLYNDKAKRATADEVLNSSPSSTTSFEEAFGEIKRYISQHPLGTAMNVVFMTDGQDTTSRDLRSAKQSFREYLQTCERETTFHAIGFTSSHQQKFLEEICTMGTNEGMYRYATGKELETRFAEMFDFADVHVRTNIRIYDAELVCGGEDNGDGFVCFDVVVGKEQLP